MKVRKLAVALALVGGLGSGVAQALGLGEIELQSYLNEPLDAEITLPQSRGVDPGDVFINIAPESAYERVGLNRNLFLSKLRFKVVTESDGSLSVNVSSTEPLREPYLNFLLELTWPNGRLMREYAVLVDPPVYAEGSGGGESVRAPSVSSSGTSQRPSAGTTPRRSQATQTQSRGYQGGTFGPTGPSDTLWEIASNARTDNSVSMQQVMLAIQDLNPDAFIDGNINRLKRGEVLRMPSIDQMRSRTRAEATRIVGVQNRAFQSPQRTVDATAQQAAQGSASPATTTGGDELKLLVADSNSQESAGSGSAGGDGQRSGGVDAGTAIVMEQLESSRRENTELNNRVDDLQNQVQTLQRLLELKNNQLADLQKVVGAPDVDQVTATDDATAVVTETEGTGQPASAEGTEQGSEVSSEIGAGVSTEAGVAEQADGQADDQGAGAGEKTVADAEKDVVEESPEASVAETAPVVAEDLKATKPVPKPAPGPVVADQGFLGNVIHAIANNPIYQFALGGGLVVLLLLLLLLARRNANREKAFYEQLNSESDEGSDSFDLNLDDDEEPEESEGADDVLAEADAYIAYGRHDQAAQTLEKAISREPSRSDLRLKLLGVYADNQDRDSFEKQFAEIEALDDEDALAAADELRSELEEAESMPSIDDLESQLRSDSFSTFDEADADEEAESAITDFEADLTDSFDLSEDDESLLEGEDESKDEKSDLIEYDLSGISLDSDDETLPEEEALSEDETETGLSESLETLESELDIEDFSLGLDEDKLDEGELEEDPLDSLADDLSDVTLEEDSEKETHDGITSLDESFLDELDAELDKVAKEEAAIFDGESEESILGDLELDVSDEDLALMEEFSDSVDSLDEDESEILSLDEELDLENTLSDVEDIDESLEELPVASDEVSTDAPKRGVADFDESDLGDDDDFDFLAGTDEAATKLDLARAYIEMGDSDGARDILEEVALEGDEEQKAEALDLLKNMS